MLIRAIVIRIAGWSKNSIGSVLGAGKKRIHIAGNDDRVLVISTFDNLGKGASGAAIECMNLMLGMPEETGLVV